MPTAFSSEGALKVSITLGALHLLAVTLGTQLLREAILPHHPCGLTTNKFAGSLIL